MCLNKFSYILFQAGQDLFKNTNMKYFHHSLILLVSIKIKKTIS